MATRIPRYDAIVTAPFGAVGVITEGEALRQIDLMARRVAPQPAANRFAAEVCGQIAAYLRSPRHCFSLPLVRQGTAYRRRVWRALYEIHSGEVLTYGELAARLGSGPRAVGGACRANPVAIVIPCHRVVASKGPGGYMGAVSGRAMRMKQWLLEHEGGR